MKLGPGLWWGSIENTLFCFIALFTGVLSLFFPDKFWSLRIMRPIYVTKQRAVAQSAAAAINTGNFLLSVSVTGFF